MPAPLKNQSALRRPDQPEDSPGNARRQARVPRWWRVRGARLLVDRDVHDFDILLGLLLVSPDVFDLVDDVQACYRSAEDGVLVVEPWLQPGQSASGPYPENQTHRFLRCYEKLRPIRVGSGIRHADRVGLVVSERGELVLELLAPNTLAASAIAERIARLRDGQSASDKGAAPRVHT